MDGRDSSSDSHLGVVEVQINTCVISGIDVT